MNHEYNSKDLERFWSQVEKLPNGCWHWTGKIKAGHGRLTWNGRMEQAHRVSYYIAHEPVPASQKILHSCQTPGCVNPEHLYLQPDYPERFWAKVEILGLDDCWYWQAGVDDCGYGTMRWINDNKMDKAHRIAWMLTNGAIPEGLEVCHTCDNPPCCNPRHLFLGTHVDNIRDMIAKGRLVTPRGEQHGEAKFSDAQIAEMREAYKQGESPVSIEKRFGVSHSHIYAILHEKSRKSR